MREVEIMADWLTHVLVALILCEVFRVDKKSLVLLGALLPDLVIKVNYLRGPLSVMPNLYPLLTWSHSIVGCALLTLAIAPLFKYKWEKTIQLVTLGWASHLFFDSIIKSFMGGEYLFFFPFSWKAYTLGLFWTEQYYVLIALTFLAYIIVWLFNRRRL